MQMLEKSKSPISQWGVDSMTLPRSKKRRDYQRKHIEDRCLHIPAEKRCRCCDVFLCDFLDMAVNVEARFELCAFYRVKDQWWPDWPFRQKCCLVHKLRPHPGSWAITQRVMETPRQETPVTPCQVHDNNPSILLHWCGFTLIFLSSRCLLRGFKHLQFLGRESGRWSVPGGPQLQHGLPTAAQHTSSQLDSTATQPAGLSPWPAAETTWQVLFCPVWG